MLRGRCGGMFQAPQQQKWRTYKRSCFGVVPQIYIFFQCVCTRTILPIGWITYIIIIINIEGEASNWFIPNHVLEDPIDHHRPTKRRAFESSVCGLINYGIIFIITIKLSCFFSGEERMNEWMSLLPPSHYTFYTQMACSSCNIIYLWNMHSELWFDDHQNLTWMAVLPGLQRDRRRRTTRHDLKKPFVHKTMRKAPHHFSSVKYHQKEEEQEQQQQPRMVLEWWCLPLKRVAPPRVVVVTILFIQITQKVYLLCYGFFMLQPTHNIQQQQK